MSDSVVSTHPLAEIIGRKLFGIEGVPTQEQSRMVRRAVKAALEWAEKVEAELAEVRKLYAEQVDLEVALRKENMQLRDEESVTMRGYREALEKIATDYDCNPQMEALNALNVERVLSRGGAMILQFGQGKILIVGIK